MSIPTTSLGALVVASIIAGFAFCAHATDDAERRAQAEQLVAEFWERVWSPPPDLRAVDDLVVDDFC